MKGGDIRTPPFLFYYNLSSTFPSSIQFKYFKNMKRIYLSLLPVWLPYWQAPKSPLNGDSLASDFRYLVKNWQQPIPTLTAASEEKYSSTNKLSIWRTSYAGLPVRNRPFDKVSIFLSNLQDGHTYLLPPTANQQANQRYLALEVRTIPDGIILQGIPETYKDLLGSRITTINGDSLEEVLARTAAIQASENLYDRYANLCRSMPTEHFLRQLFPEMKDNLHLSLLTPTANQGLTFPYCQGRKCKTHPCNTITVGKLYTDKQLAYQFIDNDKQIMLININSIMARDNFEYMQKQGLKRFIPANRILLSGYPETRDARRYPASHSATPSFEVFAHAERDEEGSLLHPHHRFAQQ